ncbi:MAG: hypothetical protein ACLFN8_01335 [Candidatus Woesearchaeota archaeon]
MGITISGMLKMEDVQNLIQSINHNYYESIGHQDMFEQNLVLWDDDSLVDVGRRLESQSSTCKASLQLQKDYAIVEARKLGGRLLPAISEFASTVNVEGRRDKYCDLRVESKTRIYNVTLLEDLISGQTFKPVINKFLIQTLQPYKGDGYHKFDYVADRLIKLDDFNAGFLEYRNRMVLQAQDRVNQYVSRAAGRMLDDLRG